jgi:DNA-binding CsgD family transcriptional regulator
VFRPSGGLVSANDHARAWLDELPDGPVVGTDLGVDVPLWVLVAAMRAGAGARGEGGGTARTRARGRSGRWLVCHASLVGAPGSPAALVVAVLEPAHPAEVAPIIVQAYDLSEREQDVIGLIARGATTQEIAAELYLSPHTVRDHVKANFAKAGVASRGELVAKLFADFYAPSHMAGAHAARVS